MFYWFNNILSYCDIVECNFIVAERIVVGTAEQFETECLGVGVYIFYADGVLLCCRLAQLGGNACLEVVTIKRYSHIVVFLVVVVSCVAGGELEVVQVLVGVACYGECDVGNILSVYGLLCGALKRIFKSEVVGAYAVKQNAVIDDFNVVNLSSSVEFESLA